MRRAVVSVVLCALLLAAVTAAADVPRTMSFQGVLRDDDGDVVPDDHYSIEFNIYDVSSGGTALWTETQNVYVEDGLYNIILGSVTALDIDFDVQYWLGITIEFHPELVPRTQLTSVPYAMRAAVADSVKPTAVVDDGDWEEQGGDVWHDGNVGVGPGCTNPSHPFEVTGDAYFYDDVYVEDFTNLWRTYIYDDVTLYYGDLDITDGDLHIGTGEIVASRVNPLSFFSIDHGATPFLYCDGSTGFIGIKKFSPAYQLDVSGTVSCTGFRLPTGATSGQVLTSDATGNATWQAAPSPPLESGKFNCDANYDLLVDCNGAQLLQNGSRDLFRIHSNVGDASVCYAYYLNGTLISQAFLLAGTNYDFDVAAGTGPYHAEVILSRPWAGGATARIDITYQNSRGGGIWHSSH